jgi:hypothetical protein
MKGSALFVVGIVGLAALVLGTGCRPVIVHERETVVAAPPPPQVVYVAEAPPPPPRIIVERGAPPSRGHLWIEGYYVYDRGRYTWVAGHWEAPPRGKTRWEPPHWDRADRGGHYTPGAWR